MLHNYESTCSYKKELLFYYCENFASKGYTWGRGKYIINNLVLKLFNRVNFFNVVGKLFHILEPNEYWYVSVLAIGTGTLFTCALVVTVGSAVVQLNERMSLKGIHVKLIILKRRHKWQLSLRISSCCSQKIMLDTLLVCW